jgi:KipI family sensor histidine kinase inhibitor
MKPRLVPLGDSAVLIRLGDEMEESVNRRVHALAALVEAAGLKGVMETVPAYASLVVHYDPLALSYSTLAAALREKISQAEETAFRKPRRIEVPLRYGGEAGVDLEDVARYLRLQVRDVIRLHTQPIYRVYMMGFTPGFPYLGKLDPALNVPRLATPRTHVPAGTVAIAGSQTGIYPVPSPGGWRLIGWTPLTLFDPRADSPFLFAPGDEVKFVEEADVAGSD